jgi:hypothetical protein
LFFQEATQALIEATTTPRHHHVQENDDDELDDEENNMNGEHSTDLRDNDDEINDPVSLMIFFHFRAFTNYVGNILPIIDLLRL